MRQRLLIVTGIMAVVVVLVLLNLATYVKLAPKADSEDAPDRSTYNGGATGTRALFDFLRESGYDVLRWRQGTSSLLSLKGSKPATFVVIGDTQVPFSKTEAKEVLHWVETGGLLILIDRTPNRDLLPDSGEWRIKTHVTNYPWPDLDPNDFDQMTHDVKPLAPSQPTLVAQNVETILPSRFAATIEIAVRGKSNATRGKDEAPGGGANEDENDLSPTPTPSSLDDSSKTSSDNASPAPTAHFVDDRGALLIDYPHGKGRIVLLSDPYIVANNGINRADNLQLAINLVAQRRGVIAFDEFHQGHAATHNALIQYFAGTPVLAICAQLALIGLAIVWSRGVRFARPLPLPQVDRRSSLEFVTSMAELQERAKAHDLALENIYLRVRRALTRYAGLNYDTGRREVVARVAARANLNPNELESLMRKCEDAINGAPINGREALRLARQLRRIESRLGLGSRARDSKQAAEKGDV